MPAIAATVSNCKLLTLALKSTDTDNETIMLKVFMEFINCEKQQEQIMIGFCVCGMSGGAAEQSGLQHGDELLQIQGVSLQDMSRFEAWNMIKALPEGSIRAVIRRRLGGIE